MARWHRFPVFMMLSCTRTYDRWHDVMTWRYAMTSWNDNVMVWQRHDMTTSWYDNVMIWQRHDMTTLWYDNVMIWQRHDMTTSWYEKKMKNEKIYFQPQNSIHDRQINLDKEQQCFRATGWCGKSYSCVDPDHWLSAIMTGRKNGVWVFGLVWKGIGRFG
jgi:hypothetical protein